MAIRQFVIIWLVVVLAAAKAVTAAVYMSVTPADIVPIGAAVTLACHTDRPVAGVAVKWYHDNVKVAGHQAGSKDSNENYREQSLVSGTWRFTILSVKSEHSGAWRCESDYPPPQSFRSAQTQLQLRVGAPRIVSLSQDVETLLGSVVYLHCNVSAEPKAVITWARAKPQGSLLPASATVDPVTDTLRFRIATVADGGVYECRATNLLGTVAGRVSVNVFHLPVIDPTLRSSASVVSWINMPVNLTCAWSAYPTPSVSWDRNGNTVDQSRVKIFTRGSISVLQVTPTTTDFGVYRCVVVNTRGRTEHRVVLVAAGKPSRPLNVRAGSTTHDTVVLLIDPPSSTGGLALTAYLVKYRKMRVLRWTKEIFTAGQNTIIDGLQPNTEYLLKVSAKNPVGFGNYSNIVRISTLRHYIAVARTTVVAPPTPGVNAMDKAQTAGPRGDPGTPSWDGDKNTDVGAGPGVQGPSPFAAVVGAVAAVFLCGVLVFLLMSLHFYRKRRKRPTEEQRLCRNRPNSMIFSEATLFQLRSDSVQYDVMPGGPGILQGEFEFPRHLLVVGTVLGTGSFGKVVRGEADGILKNGIRNVVAIKMLKENATANDRQDLLKELGVMKILKPHPNIVTLMGCCTLHEPPLIIMEYLPNGNLLQHLRSSRQRIEDLQTHRASIRTALSPTDLIRYAYEIANGMTYLASMMCIHRDLAARNILLSRDNVCKLSDFGLARDVVNGGIYQRKTQGRVPIRWMAIESLLDNVYTIQSDVWSYAVLLWEIVTIGSYPYPGMSSKKLIKELQRGYRMPRPDHCSGDVYDMMLDCWKEHPESRPTFEVIRNRLEAILIESRNYLVLDFDEQLYDYTYAGSSDQRDNV